MFTAYDDSSSPSSSDDEACTTTPLTAKKASPSITGPRTRQCPPPPTSRIVMHLDVDAFYCQCEELRDGSLKTKPFAVGQKHIIVTCNYVARSVGVTKLMLRTTAKKVCPDLIIIEGSDLHRIGDNLDGYTMLFERPWQDCRVVPRIWQGRAAWTKCLQI